jgi:poly-beta-1,6 N-acetyl-D-glucosamine synthase
MNVLYSILTHVFWFFASYFVILYLLIVFNKKNKLFKDKKIKIKNYPFVSFVISAFNEEKSIQMTIKSLMELDYPKNKYEVIILNDGSKDSTAKKVRAMGKDKRIRFIDNKKNKGKAGCLNQGISLAKGEFILCMDADSVIEKKLLKKVIPIFDKKDVGAVTVAVRVLNNNNFLTKLIEMEYYIGLSLLLRAYSLIGAIYVTPGPCSIYKTSVLKEIGGFDVTNLTEDHEIALRIVKAGYKIKHTMNAVAHTITPHTLKTLYKQRKRWYTGSLLTFMQHKDMMFKTKYGLLGWFLPYNYAVIIIGLGMVAMSLYMLTTNIIRTISYYSLTNYNFFSHIEWFAFDIFEIGQNNLLGLLSFVTAFAAVIIGLKMNKVSVRKHLQAVIFSPLLFVLYQVFWAVSYYSAITKRKVKWR